ncbi:hypothetical protein ACFVS2_25085 [Brevibacillus sp. NPDC058079]|uniref:hypothetical protein n=1 Tax=Brevibacillus sp. NPDC058079 TaxID=3346330 RepID=UPI0036E816AA
MSKYDYLQVNCGCNGLHSYTAYADIEEYQKEMKDGCDTCGQIPIIKTFDQADDPDYFINVAEGELEMYNHHSKVNDPGKEYRMRIKDVEDSAERLQIAKEICERYVK